MDVNVSNPTTVVIDHLFAFLGGGTFTVTTGKGEKVVETKDRFTSTLKAKAADGSLVVQRTTIYKTHLCQYVQTVRTIIDYPEGQSPVELAVKELNERNNRRIAATRRTLPREGAEE